MALAGILPGARHVVEQLALVKQRGIRGVQVFRPVAIKQPSAKGNNPTAPVSDRKQQTVGEEGERLLVAIFGFLDQPGLDHHGIVKALILQRLTHGLPVTGGIADPEPGNGRIIKPARPDILQRGATFRRLQAGLEIDASGLADIMQGLGALGLLCLLRCRLRHVHPGLCGEGFHRLGE